MAECVAAQLPETNPDEMILENLSFVYWRLK